MAKKETWAIVLAILAGLALLAKAKPKKGDLNFDGKIDQADMDILLSLAFIKVDPNNPVHVAADMNDNHFIDIDDLTLLATLINKQPPTPPPTPTPTPEPTISGVQLTYFNQSGVPTRTFSPGESLTVNIKDIYHGPTIDAMFWVGLGRKVNDKWEWASEPNFTRVAGLSDGSRVEFNVLAVEIPANLAPGKYAVVYEAVVEGQAVAFAWKAFEGDWDNGGLIEVVSTPTPTPTPTPAKAKVTMFFFWLAEDGAWFSVAPDGFVSISPGAFSGGCFMAYVDPESSPVTLHSQVSVTDPSGLKRSLTITGNQDISVPPGQAMYIYYENPGFIEPSGVWHIEIIISVNGNTLDIGRVRIQVL